METADIVFAQQRGRSESPMSHPPVTFATLPLELKSKVVELCRWQDEDFRKRWTTGRKGASLV